MSQHARVAEMEEAEHSYVFSESMLLTLSMTRRPWQNISPNHAFSMRVKSPSAYACRFKSRSAPRVVTPVAAGEYHGVEALVDAMRVKSIDCAWKKVLWQRQGLRGQCSVGRWATEVVLLIDDLSEQANR